jgi:hypothetical protein
MVPHPIRVIGALVTAVLIGGAASAEPRVDARTRLSHCGTATCLTVTGRRPDATAQVTLAGHAVQVDTVRAWVPSHAHQISVRVGGADGDETAALLPIGLLGNEAELASLEVRPR